MFFSRITGRYKKHIVMIGTFHGVGAYLKMLGEKMQGTGLGDILIEAGLITSGSLQGVLAGKQYSRAMTCHKAMLEALERFLLAEFLVTTNRSSLLDRLEDEQSDLMQELLERIATSCSVQTHTFPIQLRPWSVGEGVACGEKLIVQGELTKKPADWKEFLTNDQNKVQLIQLILKIWSSADFATHLTTRNVIVISEGHAYQLQSLDGNTTEKKEVLSLHSSQKRRILASFCTAGLHRIMGTNMSE